MRFDILGCARDKRRTVAFYCRFGGYRSAKKLRALVPDSSALGSCGICSSSAHCKVFQLGTFVELRRQPPRLTATARPSLRAVIRIDVLRSDLPPLGSRCTSAEQLAHRKSSVLNDCFDLLLYLGALAL